MKVKPLSEIKNSVQITKKQSLFVLFQVVVCSTMILAATATLVSAALPKAAFGIMDFTSVAVHTILRHVTTSHLASSQRSAVDPSVIEGQTMDLLALWQCYPSGAPTPPHLSSGLHSSTDSSNSSDLSYQWRPSFTPSIC